jgi:competence protein CoiA
MLDKMIKSEFKSSRCCGLIQGYALKKIDNKKVYIHEVTKIDGPFYCSECLSEAIVRKCTEKVDHFAHKARLSPVLSGKNESKLHFECKNKICDYLKTKFPDGNWELERTIKKSNDKKELIPDISGRINQWPIAIEVQKTPYTVDKIRNKTIEYYKRKIYVLWVIPLSEDLGEESFRPRLYEKYLHSMYFGRTYYYVVGNNSITPVHYSPAKRYIEEATWYEDGEEINVGGYYLTYKTIKSPNYSTDLDISVDFQPEERKSFKCKNNAKDIPQCKIFKDKLVPWWDKEEFYDRAKQKEVVKNSRIFTYIDYYDDYDDYDNDNCDNNLLVEE